ncbi:MAG: PEP-CTERM sorting domain-containing protein [Bryobacterales bacterium]|nr:PEP-CTERM sorting domain-containing protein [Bryobacterales bacterium]
MKTLLRFGVWSLLLSLTAWQAQAVPLSDLLGGGSITCGDKIFTNFRLFTTGGSGGADAPSAAEIFVVPDTSSCGTVNPGPGLLFNSAMWNVNAGQTIDTGFTFDVIAPGPLITDARLALLSFDAEDGGQIHISESIFVGTNNIVNLSVDSLTGPFVDWHKFPSGPYSIITVNKDISLEGHANGNATLSTFTQHFSQVPEPATLALVGLALLGAGLARLRRG